MSSQCDQDFRFAEGGKIRCASPRRLPLRAMAVAHPPIRSRSEQLRHHIVLLFCTRGQKARALWSSLARHLSWTHRGEGVVVRTQAWLSLRGTFVGLEVVNGFQGYE